MSLVDELIAELKGVCAGLPAKRKGPCRDDGYAIADIGLSAFSIFFMGSPSFLAHQRALAEGHGQSNCETLFGMSAIPSDSYFRLMLDGAAPAAFDGLFFKAIEAAGPLTLDRHADHGRVDVDPAGADRAGRNPALLFAQDQMPAVFHTAPFRRRHGILPYFPGSYPGRSGSPAGSAPATGVHRAAGRGGEAGL